MAAGATDEKDEIVSHGVPPELKKTGRYYDFLYVVLSDIRNELTISF